MYTKVLCMPFYVENLLMFLGASENNKGSLDFKTVALGVVSRLHFYSMLGDLSALCGSFLKFLCDWNSTCNHIFVTMYLKYARGLLIVRVWVCLLLCFLSHDCARAYLWLIAELDSLQPYLLVRRGEAKPMSVLQLQKQQSALQEAYLQEEPHPPQWKKRWKLPFSCAQHK